MNVNKIDEYLQEAISDGVIPGAVFSAGDADDVFICKAYGKRSLLPGEELMTVDTVFDLASLTKVVSVWPAAVKLMELGTWKPETTVGDIDADVKELPVGRVSVAQLLTHTGGLPERTWLVQYGRERAQIYQGICGCELESEPGTHVAYSNRGFILLGFLIERTVKQNLNEFVRNEIWSPAGMHRTMYNPVGLSPVAPTEFGQERGQCICGSVHDENARVLNGVAGHAGVFSDIYDLSRFCTMIVRGGELSGKRVLSQEWIERSLQNYTENLNDGRGLAWQKRPGGNAMYRHFGFTGTSIWIDPEKGRWAVMLSNRVHPDRHRYADGIQKIRAEIQNRMDQA